MVQKVRYKRLGYVELNVSDLQRSRDFYEGIVGLQFVGEGPLGELRFRCSQDPYGFVLHQGDKPGHKRTGWMLEDNLQFGALITRLDKAGVSVEHLSEVECTQRGFDQAIRAVDPNVGALMEYYTLRDTSPQEFITTHTKIQRLGHVVFGTPKFHETLEFYQNVLNFEPSDFIKNFFGFFHAWPNPFHHGFGVGNMPAPIYHHTNFMVSEVDDLGKAIHRLNRAGVPIVYGPGRHVASGSAFLYFLDPDGITVEYSFGMEEFPEENARSARVLEPRPEVADQWLSPLDPRMAKVGAIEHYEIAH